MACRKLIVGLGNPGRKYAPTRHNVGFRVLAELARRFALGSPKSKFQGELVEVTIGGERTLLLCPQTYMNRSGSSVQPARDFYQLANEDLLIVCDDFHLPLAKLRMRATGSSGGQKGMEDILRRLGTRDIARLRIGIGSPPENWDMADYVLSRFGREEEAEMETCVERAADAATDWVVHGIEYCMNHYNAG